MIYGITGRKFHGKDTFANIVVKNNPGFVILHFAGHLKYLAGQIFGLTHYQMHDPILKETPFEVPLVMDDFVRQMSQATGLIIFPRGMVAKNPREVLQFFGTEYVRYVKGSFWVDYLISAAKLHENVLVPDTRFLNEALAIKATGGKIFRITRVDLVDSNDTHASETEMDSIKCDLYIGTKTGPLEDIEKIVSEINWGSAP
jgi:hypothetical protein